MFLLVGTLIGLNLMVRVMLGETREIQSTRGGTRIALGDVPGIALRGLPFLAVPVAIGLGLDAIFHSSISGLFG